MDRAIRKTKRAQTSQRRIHSTQPERFVDCEIYGPATVVPVESLIGGKTFINCSWDEDPWHRWRGSSVGRYYVGAIRLQDCVFQDCHFRGVGLVVEPDEYDEKMKEHEKS